MQYRVAEKVVTLYNKPYRTLVIHFSAHDKRWTKRLYGEIKSSKKTLTKLITKETKNEFYSRADADIMVSKLNKTVTKLHSISVCIEEKFNMHNVESTETTPTRLVLRIKKI